MRQPKLGDGPKGPWTDPKQMNQTTDATPIFAPIWKRKWLILIVALLVAAGSYYYYHRKPSVYSATTQIYLGNGVEEQAQLSSSGGGNAGKRATTPNGTTQAELINSSLIKDLVHKRLHKLHKSATVHVALKGKAKAKSVAKSDFITVNGEAHSSRAVALLVNATAQTYIARENAHYRREVDTAIGLARRQLRRVEAGQVAPVAHAGGKSKSAGAKGSSSATAALQSATLSSKINQLEGDLSIKEVTQLNPATRHTAKLVSPHPKSNAIFGFVIGLLLATFAAYALGRLDRRLRSLAAIEAIFQTQILTALRAVRRPIVQRDGQSAPAKPLREALWRLQTAVQVGNRQEDDRERAPSVILCVSADAGDGKSTLVAGLGLVQGETGERVAIIEADFRRPVLAALLQVSGPQGLADVLAGRLTVEEAMQAVSLVHPHEGVSSVPAVAAGATATVVESAGSVSVLVGATNVANPPALLVRPAMTELPRSLSNDFDYVLIDAPSPLQVSDVMPLLGLVDGIVIVARVGHTRETSARRLVQLLDRTPGAPVLGVVANAVSQADIEKYGLAGQHRRRWRHKLIGR
jgi:Mrp family chromosome partitioning ATPase/capsular polysaccharide biosynthesis protein